MPNAASSAAEMRQPGTSSGLLALFHHAYLLRLLINKGVATRYHGSVLGWAWSYVLPATQFVVYYLVFGYLFQLNRGVDNFAVHLFAGIVVVNLFTEALRNSTESIVDNRDLVRKIYLPRELFPMAAIAVAFVHFLPQALILLAVCLLLGWSISVLQVLAFMGGIILIVVLAAGLGLFFGALNVAFRDAANFVGLLLMLVTWTSPVLYPWTLVQQAFPPGVFTVYMLNPITIAVELFHVAFWQPISDSSLALPPNFMQYTIGASLISVATLLLGQWVFKRREGTFAQDL